MHTLFSTVIRAVPLTACLLALNVVAHGNPPTENGAGKAAAITWKDTTGHAYGMADVARNKATVFFFTSTQSPSRTSMRRA